MATVKQLIEQYKPTCDQESQDQRQMLACIAAFDDVLTRQNTIAHLTASGLIFNKARTHVLMIYHKIYDSWGWTGGHADGDADLLAVATREAFEETGVHGTPITTDIISLDVMNVPAHVKKGQFISSHLHLNVAYAFEADEAAAVVLNEEETNGVMWIAIDELPALVKEEHMKPVYDKIVARVRAMTSS